MELYLVIDYLKQYWFWLWASTCSNYSFSCGFNDLSELTVLGSPIHWDFWQFLKPNVSFHKKFGCRDTFSLAFICATLVKRMLVVTFAPVILMFRTYFYTFQTNAEKNASKSFCCPCAGDEVLHHWDKQASTGACYRKENVHESRSWSTNQFLWSLYDLSGTTNCCTERFGLYLHRLLFPPLWRQKMNGPIGAIMGYLLLPSL